MLTDSQNVIKLPHFGAFESTRIHGSGTDILATTRHLERWREDLDLLKSSGIVDLRYSVPWHRIEQVPGEYDFSWIDGPMEHMRRQRMFPIIDLLHHTSFPDWLEEGFANPQFPDFYARFVQRFSERYGWADRITLFNEPLATTLMCTIIGAWYPHRTSDEAFVKMAFNVTKAMSAADRILRKANSRYTCVYIDTCESHQADDRRSANWVRLMNDRRFCILDLLLGAINKYHPIFSWFIQNGLREDDLKWAEDNRAVPDILGLDYYPHSEMEWFWSPRRERTDIRWPNRDPRGFFDVAVDYVNHFQLPVMLSETNIRGTVSDRVTWLRFMQEQTEKLALSGADVRGFCWYPSIDSTDWCNLCTRCTNSVDPQGIWYLDEQDSRWTRFPSELSEWYEKLARGAATHRDLPAYQFLAPLDHELSGYVKLMKHWDGWVEAPDVEIAA
ncbi:MAG: hypothetical protein QOJ99_6192 [Bryobacterales bacterium]|nr:hypothetical protein [Bryobacterales bacterium]